MNVEKAEYLQKILRYAVACPQFRDNVAGNRETHCNQFTYSVLNVVAAMIYVTYCKNAGTIPKNFQYQCSDFHYDVSSALPGRPLADVVLRLPIDVSYQNLVHMAQAGIETAKTHDFQLDPQADRYPVELTQEQAHDAANEGVPVLVISAKHNAPLRIQQGLPAIGHEAIVFPTLKPFEGVVTVAQAGPPGIYKADSEYSFGQFWHYVGNDIKFFSFPLEV